ncbi:hypothetical protein DRO53_01795 [Candidatus Bathyarchaeota archaeon]|nr:MAG: hypothetical protein DRO53_01795 [Candidatus Bathyarchaeota archaeon]
MGTYISSIVVEKCHYCEVCPPQENCPSGAFHRLDPDYPPVIEKEICMGCGTCVESCLHGAVTLVKRA